MGRENASCCCFSLGGWTIILLTAKLVMALFLALVSIQYATDVDCLADKLGLPSALVLSYMIILAVFSIIAVVFILLAFVGVFTKSPSWLVPLLFLIPIWVFVFVILQIIVIGFSIGCQPFIEIVWWIGITFLIVVVLLIALAVIYNYLCWLRQRENIIESA